MDGGRTGSAKGRPLLCHKDAIWAVNLSRTKVVKYFYRIYAFAVKTGENKVRKGNKGKRSEVSYRHCYQLWIFVISAIPDGRCD
ncbi:12453_t:CDS:2 [Acaulospora morrowiae]|uniref:12453_t:CDS:1 n=1 Tax=Acaulospora morrowiae TaxID=94023 RepID=A0A9N9EI80_9GLOM|nr:12453_t:CDS:2 [Acaulospora morrowiae]